MHCKEIHSGLPKAEIFGRNRIFLLFSFNYDRNHLFGLGSDTDTETENWPKLLADTETNRNHKILNWKALHQGVCKKFSCHVHYQNIFHYTNFIMSISNETIENNCKGLFIAAKCSEFSHFFRDFEYLYHLESLNAVLYLSGHN